MPSIPQSLLWISLVVLWLFVLVPMLISKRDAVRRTSDVALATRVLNRGSAARLLRRSAPAAGHASDPDWQPSDDDLDDFDDDADEERAERPKVLATSTERTDDEECQTDELTLDFGDSVVEQPVVAEPEPEPEPVAEADPGAEIEDEVEVEAEVPAAADVDDPDELDTDEYEYVADSSGLEAPSETELELVDSLSAARRRRYDTSTAAAVSARKFKFRKRMVMTLGVLLVASAVAAYLVSPALWWASGAVGGFTVIYLAYLRRQTRIEERLRRRRAQRIARSRLGVENTDDREFDVVPARLRRPGSVVLEIDDEDPIFEHLEYTTFAREYDLPRASGQ